MKRIVDSSAGCPGGLWTWVHAETGHRIQHSNFPGIRNAVRVFLRANSFPITAHFEEELEANLCAHGARCEEFISPSLLEKMSSLAQALYKAGREWREPIVTAEVLQGRRDICTACNWYAGSTSLLKVACSKCGCSGLKLAIPSSSCPAGKWNSI